MKTGNAELIGRAARARSNRSKGVALAVLATAQLVIALDYSVVNMALPDIGRSLGFAGGTVQWVISAYALTFGGFLLLGGRAADLLGRRRMFMVALGLFGVASLAGGFTRHGGLLIACRLVQGLGGALLFPATLSLVNTIFDEGRERTRAIAVWGSAGASRLSVGVLAGGVLTGLFGWPAVFFVNVPIVVALLAVAPLVLPEGRPSSPVRRFDLPGALLVTLAAMTIVDTLVQAPTVGWASTRTLLGAGAGLVLLGLFVVWSGGWSLRCCRRGCCGPGPCGVGSWSRRRSCPRSACSCSSSPCISSRCWVRIRSRPGCASCRWCCRWWWEPS
jgi:MFS family permease